MPVRDCQDTDFEAIYAIVNDAALAYKGIIPPDRWKEPYMSREELRKELDDGVRFVGWEEDSKLIGVMGFQDVRDVSLIRHAYEVLTQARNMGYGSKLMTHILGRLEKPVLAGTWAAAGWAIRFYEKHGFKMVTPEQKDRLLKAYWKIPRPPGRDIGGAGGWEVAGGCSKGIGKVLAGMRQGV